MTRGKFVGGVSVLLSLISSAAFAAETVPVLFIGDSHTVGTFGETLDTLLRSRNGLRVRTVGSCGISPNGFLDGLTCQCGLRFYEIDQTEKYFPTEKTPKIDNLLAELRPAITVIALGANQIDTATSQPETQKRFVANLVAKVKAAGSQCLWIGPPSGRNKTEPKFSNLYKVLGEGVGSDCTFFDSRPESLPYLDYEKVSAQAGVPGDGRHYDALGEAGRTVLRRWALDAYRAFEPLLPQ